MANRSGARDRSDQGKFEALQEVLEHLEQAKLLDLGQWKSAAALINAIATAEETAPNFDNTRIMSLTEFTRDVHAEAAVLTSAARLGIESRNSTLVVTTYPCHNCAKHIIASGIRRVVYIEPYPKSYAYEFYAESIEPERESTGKVSFVPFTGVAPRRYEDWFRMREKRKDQLGRRRPWFPRDAVPAFIERYVNEEYLQREEFFQAEIGPCMNRLAKTDQVNVSSVPGSPQ